MVLKYTLEGVGYPNSFCVFTVPLSICCHVGHYCSSHDSHRRWLVFVHQSSDIVKANWGRKSFWLVLTWLHVQWLNCIWQWSLNNHTAVGKKSKGNNLYWIPMSLSTVIQHLALRFLFVSLWLLRGIFSCIESQWNIFCEYILYIHSYTHMYL